MDTSITNCSLRDCPSTFVIAAQVEHKFGANGRYLVDLFHVCEYLGAAAKAIVGDTQAAKRWLETQKERLKTQRVNGVISELSTYLEAAAVTDGEAQPSIRWV